MNVVLGFLNGIWQAVQSTWNAISSLTGAGLNAAGPNANYHVVPQMAPAFAGQGMGRNISNSVSFGDVHVRSQEDIELLAYRVAEVIRRHR